MANKKKLLTSAVAVATAATLLLGGTFAWQSISQTALNEKEAVVNPGGRLHDDFNGKNKDVYVENFADDDIFARLRLDEYFEIVTNKGTASERTYVITDGAEKNNPNTYATHKFDAANTTDTYWKWTTGGKTLYMPTFNKNKDSLKADINGTYAATDDAGNHYADYIDYSTFSGNDLAGETVTGLNAGKTAMATYDNDSNSLEDDGITSVSETHYVASTQEAALISMEDWLALNGGVYSEETHGGYWVYDTDGWCYWSSPIKAGTATGLLLDGISLKTVMDDSYYYAINAVGQFITADDLGDKDNTGFYDAAAGSAPTDNALQLLKSIGVQVADDTSSGGSEEEPAQPLKLVYMSDKVNLSNHRPAMYLLVQKDGKYLSDTDFDNVTLYLKNGDSTLTLDSSQYTVDEEGLIKVLLDEKGWTFNDGTTSIEVYVAYDDGETTLTSDTVTFEFSKQTVTLTTAGSSYTIDGNAILALDGASYDALIADFDSEESRVCPSQINITKDDQEVRFNGGGTAIDSYEKTKEWKGLTDGGQKCSVNGFFEGQKLLGFIPKETGTFVIKITIDDVEYTTTLTVNSLEPDED